jgi:hypothetical protein
VRTRGATGRIRVSKAGGASGVTGSLYFIAIVAIGAIIAAVTGTIFLLVPFIVIALGILLVPIAWRAVRGTRLEPGHEEHHGVPSTRDASYEPVQQPRKP